MKLSELKEKVLYRSSWHHTSKHFNRTDFYSVDYDEDYDYSYNLPEPEKVEVPNEKLVYAHFLEWSGTRNYPKCTDHCRWGVIKGNTFYYISHNDLKSKRTTANGFNVLDESNISYSKDNLSKILNKEYRTSIAKKGKLSVDEITGMSLYYANSLYHGNEIVRELIKTGFKNKHVVLLSKNINKYLDEKSPKIDEKNLNASNLDDIRSQVTMPQEKMQTSAGKTR